VTANNRLETECTKSTIKAKKKKKKQSVSALVLLVGWQEVHPACKEHEWWGGGMVICLERGADLHMAQVMPLLLTVLFQ